MGLAGRGGSRQTLLEGLAAVISDTRVLQALASTPRECFVPTGERDRAYENVPLDIGCGQTISQPLVVARMLELLALTGRERVLDVGTGSGYHAALLARLAGEVWSVERHGALRARAAANLRAADSEEVHLIIGDGYRGLVEHAPYDAISVAATAARGVPAALERQLARGGRLVLPVGTGENQRLVLIHRRLDGELQRRFLERVRFVNLVAE